MIDDMSLDAFPLADADKCVKCALCLPHCPTYKAAKDEGESPRGRIALMQGLATGALELTRRLETHLDNCLACRACEAVCPAEVPYGKLIDAARRELRKRGHQEPWLARHFVSHLRGGFRRRLMQRFIRLAQATGLARLAAAMGPATLERMLEYAPVMPKPKAWRETYEPRKASGVEVQLFLGCVADMTQPQVSAATIAVLNAIGIRVHLPKTQVCCGALDQHAGRTEAAAKLARRNSTAFAGEQPVLGTASGCLATLRDYGELAGEAGGLLAFRAEDISSYLARNEIIPRIEFQPWQAKVVVQQACTLRNVLQGDQAVLDLLKLIPELKLRPLPASLGCCGAAGSYMLNHTEQADAFAEPFVKIIAEQRPDALVSSNVGCALHLSAALRRRGLHVPVMHPVEILAQQLPEAMYRPGI